MIITEIITENGKKYLHTYSNLGLKIVRDGVEYDDAIDPENSERVYVEATERSDDE